MLVSYEYHVRPTIRWLEHTELLCVSLYRTERQTVQFESMYSIHVTI